VLLDLGLEEDLDTGLIGRFFNAVDEGVEPLVKHKGGVIALSDAGAHLVYLCEPGSASTSSGTGFASAAPSTCPKACGA